MFRREIEKKGLLSSDTYIVMEYDVRVGRNWVDRNWIESEMGRRRAGGRLEIERENCRQ